ncbi:MAG: hypothetical protein H6500_01120 [Candidatus Woesearchaeota archaeon]|nr:hypothetical protein [Nanoarchaeota archaeon]USN44433.1 MAG: hypothetical protein H6500_01120 [Candidatus Woesearchaeota archaeon]
MMITTKIHCSFEKNSDLFYKVLSSEDFDFRTKNISLNLNKAPEGFEIALGAPSILDFKIGINALVRSLEVAEKTLETVK